MADLPSDFWGGWIVTITVASFIALLWLVIDVYRSGPDENEDLVWDETLREGAKPAPIWWFWFILALMTISVIYVMLYPGLGQWRGALGWSMGSRIAERIRRLRIESSATCGAACSRQPLAALAESEARDDLCLARVQQPLQLLPWPRCCRAGQDISGPHGQLPGNGARTNRRSSRPFIQAARLRCRAGARWLARQGSSKLADHVLALVARRCTPTRRPRAAHCSSSTAWPAMGPAAKAIRCWARRR